MTTTTNPEISNVGIAPNAKRLLWAGFFAILAAGVGAAIRGGILDNWGRDFGFTGAELGNITGAGFSGFCFGIIIGGVVCDKIGYGKLVVAAFVLHALSAFITFTPKVGMAQSAVYNYLFWGTFIFAVANGTLEAVANPLVATLLPHNRTHFLNILHASWPAGLVIGSAMGWVLDDKLQWNWKIQLALFLVPTLGYGIMFFGQHFPKSEASQKGLSLGQMFKDVGLLGALIVCVLLSIFLSGIITPMLKSPNAADIARNIGYVIGGILLIAVGIMTRFSLGSILLFVLFVAHLLVGAVELGTDGWIQNITGNLFTSEQGKWLFIWTSAIMFSLRFCADFIEKRLGFSPVGILVTCAILACIGLNLASRITSITVAFLALAVYAVGKTFFWPTMLAVASDRFPRTGAIAISMMGGIGMLSAGIIGAPGLGYAKDRFAGETLEKENPAVFAQYKAPAPSHFLFFKPASGFDGTKIGAVQQKVQTLRAENATKGITDPQAALQQLSPEERAAFDAGITGDRKTLVADSFIPATMALIYLVLLVYFKTIGGYRAVHITETTEAREPARAV
jgi:MFS family permease